MPHITIRPRAVKIEIGDRDSLSRSITATAVDNIYRMWKDKTIDEVKDQIREGLRKEK